jgi:hypothetical protein
MGNIRGFFAAAFFLSCVHVNAEFVTCDVPTIDINEGDVVSADMMNDILNRLNNVVTGGMTNTNILGTWRCTATIASGSAGTANGFALDSITNLYRSTQDVEFTPFGDGERVNMTAENVLCSLLTLGQLFLPHPYLCRGQPQLQQRVMKSIVRRRRPGLSRVLAPHQA